VHHRFRKGEAWCIVEKEGDRGHRPCEETRVDGRSARTSVVVAEVGRRTSGLEYARAQGSKKSDGASEQWPSPERLSAVTRRREFRVKGRRESDAAGHATVTDRAQTHGGVSSAIERSSRDSESGAAVAGPGL
jgi:hypothetical protein